MLRLEIFHPWVQLPGKRVLGMAVADRRFNRIESLDRVRGRNLDLVRRGLDQQLERRLVSSSERFLGFLVDSTDRPQLEVLDNVLKSGLNVSYVDPREITKEIDFAALLGQD